MNEHHRTLPALLIPDMIRLLIISIVLTVVLSQRFKKIYTPIRDLRFRKLATYRASNQLPLAGLQSTRRQTDHRFDKVGECPRYSTNRRSCVNELFFTYCSSDYDCSGQQKCCMYGCGRERRCFEAVNIPNGCVYGGEKYPEMSTFSASDGCNKCRCERGQVTCSKTKCVECIYEGIPYSSQYMFKAKDGCNLCRCLPNRSVQCTKEACNRQVEEKLNRCTEPLKRGYCKASITRFWYNPDQQKCETFDYTGCYGNRNNFETLQECMMECQSDG